MLDYYRLWGLQPSTGITVTTGYQFNEFICIYHTLKSTFANFAHVRLTFDHTCPRVIICELNQLKQVFKLLVPLFFKFPFVEEIECERQLYTKYHTFTLTISCFFNLKSFKLFCLCLLV